MKLSTARWSKSQTCHCMTNQVVTRHAADEIIFPKEGYSGLSYTGNLILIQITWVAGRSTEVKKKFYKRLADEFHDRAKGKKRRCLDKSR